MCPVTLRLIMNMYISQKLQVRFSNVLSSQFNVGNGVKQGGVLLPISFTINIMVVVKSVRKTVVIMVINLLRLSSISAGNEAWDDYRISNVQSRSQL